VLGVDVEFWLLLTYHKQSLKIKTSPVIKGFLMGTSKLTTLDNDCVITLYDLVKVINEDRITSGKRPLEHGKQMVKVDELAKEPSFGTVAKMSIVYNDKGQTVETYHLTKKQAIAVGAKIDNRRLMIVVDRLEELAKQEPRVPRNKKLAMLVEMAFHLDEVENRVDEVEDRLDAIDTAVDFFTVIGYASYMNTRIALKEAQDIGRECAKHCKKFDISTGTVPDPRFGKVKTSPREVLELYFR
jgi:hypothetical protein